MAEVLLEERGYRGINPATLDLHNSSTVGLPVNPEHDMSGVVRLFTGCVKDSVSAFLAVGKKPLQGSDIRLRGDLSLSRLWNNTLAAEKEKLKASLRLRVDRILLGKECRRRLK
jgi:hypothetical protein